MSLNKIYVPVEFGDTFARISKSNVYKHALKYIYKIFRHTQIGLDINTTYVRWVQIDRSTEEKPVIQQYGIMPFDAEKTEIRKILKSLNLKYAFSKNVTGIALTDSSVQKKTLTLDAGLSAIQLGKKFNETAVSLFNRPAKDIYYQHHVLGFSKNHSSQLNFLFVAVEKEIIEKSLALLKSCQLRPNLIDVESFATARGQEILKDRQINFASHLDTHHFIKNSEKLTLSLGLAMHPKPHRFFL